MSEYARRTSTDSPERKQIIHESPHIQLLRSMARANRLSFRRHRYGVGRTIVYDIGEYGQIGLYGRVIFTDNARVKNVHMVGGTEVGITISKLVKVLPLYVDSKRREPVIEFIEPPALTREIVVQMPDVTEDLTLPLAEQIDTESIPTVDELIYFDPIKVSWVQLIIGLSWFTLFFVIWMVNPFAVEWIIVACLSVPLVLWAIYKNDRALEARRG